MLEHAVVTRATAWLRVISARNVWAIVRSFRVCRTLGLVAV